jgi:hypothetical protein
MSWASIVAKPKIIEKQNVQDPAVMVEKKVDSKQLHPIVNPLIEHHIPVNTDIGSGFGSEHVEEMSKSAMIYFLRNAMYRVLTTDSSSCITLLATLPDERKTCCFTHLQPDEEKFGDPIRTMLIKIMMTSDKSTYYKGKKVQSFIEFRNEIDTQIDIWKCSAREQLNAICPQIFWASTISNDHRKEYYRLFSNGIDKEHHKNIELFFRNSFQTSIICMEYLEGYQSVEYHRTHGIDIIILANIICDPLIYELMRLLSCGYVHKDLNYGNIMYHPHIPNYYGNNHMGRIKIIDFGKIQKIKDIPDTKEKLYEQVVLRFYTRLLLEQLYCDPNQKIVMKINKYREQIDYTTQLLLYGTRYERDIRLSGKDPTIVHDIIDFLYDQYVNVIKRNRTSLGKHQRKNHKSKKKSQIKEKNHKSKKKSQVKNER